MRNIFVVLFLAAASLSAVVCRPNNVKAVTPVLAVSAVEENVQPSLNAETALSGKDKAVAVASPTLVRPKRLVKAALLGAGVLGAGALGAGALGAGLLGAGALKGAAIGYGIGAKHGGYYGGGGYGGGHYGGGGYGGGYYGGGGYGGGYYGGGGYGGGNYGGGHYDYAPSHIHHHYHAAPAYYSYQPAVYGGHQW